MAEEIVGAYQTRSYNVPEVQVTLERRLRVHYEVWTNQTLVLRTVHQAQAVRRATEVQGHVHTVQQAGWQ